MDQLIGQAELDRLVDKYNYPELAKEDDMVYQVWGDGEVTLQKSGSLLWQRNLHMIIGGMPKAMAILPEKSGRSHHSYMFTTKEGAYALHRFIAYAYADTLDDLERAEVVRKLADIHTS